VKRVVPDSNVLVSALQFGGKPMAILTLAEDGQIDLAISEAILNETLSVLKLKFQSTPEQLADREAYVRAVTRIIAPSEIVTVIQADPTDDRILECAVAADAEVIVSGDRHLLALENFRASVSRSRRTSSPGSRRAQSHK
jgi:putative PIN family toxin of toxin-antitoxin system